MEFRVLGPLEVLDAGRRVELGASQRALLAYLLIHADEAVAPERLMEEVWGESRATVAANHEDWIAPSGGCRVEHRGSCFSRSGSPLWPSRNSGLFGCSEVPVRESHDFVGFPVFLTPNAVRPSPSDRSTHDAL